MCWPGGLVGTNSKEAEVLSWSYRASWTQAGSERHFLLRSIVAISVLLIRELRHRFRDVSGAPQLGRRG